MEYEQIIDSLAERKESVTAKLIRDGIPWLPSAEKAKFNSLVQSFSEAQRELLAELIQCEKEAGIHDALAALSELMNLEGLRFSVQGKELPHEPYGTELHFDWVARSCGEAWPKK